MIETIIIFLVLLSVLVLVHELGHFFTARWIGAKVEEFGIGFPPRAASFVRKGIRYSLNWIPIGGFVKIKGESGEDRSDSDSFASKPIWKRFIVLFAGVFMNFILAAVLFAVGFGVGIPHIIDEGLSNQAIVQEESVSVVQVLDGSMAEEAGVLPGDAVVQVNGAEVGSAEGAGMLIANAGSESVTLVIERGDEQIMYSIEPTLIEGHDVPVLGVALTDTGLVTYPWYLLPVKGLESAAFYTKEIVVAFYELIRDLILNEPVEADLAGPVGIAELTGEAASLGFVYLLQFAALLSLHLAVLNVLPLPALDGGRIFFLAIEAIIRKPVSQKLEGMIHQLGFVALMILVIVITYQDIVKLVN